MPEMSHPLAAWESFYVIVGSSGGALIGLQFVVITLISDRHSGGFGALNAFGTPTVVHFAGALAISAIMSAPWPSLGDVSLLLATCGVAGFAYGAVVIRRALRQTEYKPDAEDWLWYLVVPWIIYATLAASAWWLRTDGDDPLFLIAGCALALLLIGIRNAWDTVTHVAITMPNAAKEKSE